jgi:hypothetical protein
VKEKEIQTELASIRNLMERSSKFISLSGLSGILAGVYALIGAAAAYKILNMGAVASPLDAHYHITDDLERITQVYQLLFVAIIVVICALLTGFILTRAKAKRKDQAIWGKTSRSLLFNMATPLITGGILIIIFISRGYYGIAAPCSLIFYGLALVSASSYTFTDVKYLGICEILLGLVAACLPGYGLLFWAIGFGVLHIVYGSVMYFKYDR